MILHTYIMVVSAIKLRRLRRRRLRLSVRGYWWRHCGVRHPRTTGHPRIVKPIHRLRRGSHSVHEWWGRSIPYVLKRKVVKTLADRKYCSTNMQTSVILKNRGAKRSDMLLTPDCIICDCIHHQQLYTSF